MVRPGNPCSWCVSPMRQAIEEAIAVGVTKALHEDEFVLPMHRNLGVFTTRNFPLHRLMSQWMGKVNGYTKGRDRSFHFGNIEKKTLGMISHLGPQMGVALGTSLSYKAFSGHHP